MEELFYLIECAAVSQNGVLRGTSLRTYECTREIDTKRTNGNYTAYKYTPTSVMYILDENSQIIEKKTKADLSNKYISAYAEINSTASWSYGTRVFTSPELALFSKLRSIYIQTAELHKNIETTLSNIQAFDKYLDHYKEFLNKYPELAI